MTPQRVFLVRSHHLSGLAKDSGLGELLHPCLMTFDISQGLGSQVTGPRPAPNGVTAFDKRLPYTRHSSLCEASYNAACYGLAPGFGHPLALLIEGWRGGSSSSALDLPARTWSHLLLGVLPAGVSDQGPHRAGWHPARRGISPSSGEVRLGALLVCAHSAVAFSRTASAHGHLLGRDDRIVAACPQHLAARHAGHLLRVFFVIRQRCPGFLRIPVRRNVAGGGVSLVFLCITRAATRTWPRPSSLTSKPVSAAVGVVSYLFRIGLSEVRQRRDSVARLHRHGRVLPERSPAHLDRLVRPALAAQFSRIRHRRHSGAGSGASVDVVYAATLAYRMFLHRYALADSGNSYGELHLSELPRSAAGGTVARRPLFDAMASAVDAATDWRAGSIGGGGI